MNKREARKIARESQFTVGELRKMISESRKLSREPLSGMSRVNPMIPYQKALDIYEAVLSKKPDDQVFHDRLGNDLIITNILRDCG